MTGNHPGRSGNPARRANPGLDQLAAQIRNDRKAGHPELVALAGVEEHLLDVFLREAGEQIDLVQAGVTMLVMGQVFNQVVSQLPAEEFQRAPGLMVNSLRMIGQRLYSGDLPKHQLQCPFPLATGRPCPFKPRSSMGATLTAVMRGHVALHHPGETWPPPDDDIDALPDAELLDDQADDNVPELVNGPRSANHPSIAEPKSDPTIATFTAGVPADVDEDQAAAHAELIAREQQFIQQLSASPNDEPGGETPILDQLRAEYRNRPAAAVPRPYGVCQNCGKVRALDADGIVVPHTRNFSATFSEVPCDGGGLHPLPDVLAVDHDHGTTASIMGTPPQSAPPVLGQCPTCERNVPLERPSIVASHCIENTHLECPGTGLEPVEYAGASFDASVWAPPGVRTFHPDGSVTYHEEDVKRYQAAGLIPVVDDDQGKQIGDATITAQPDGTVTMSADVDASALPPHDLKGFSVRADWTAPVDPAECPHRKHDRVRRLGVERCIACGSAIEPDDAGAAGA